MVLRFYDTLERDKRTFSPLVKNEVKMYACGPTVYNYIHIGNIRTFVFVDILKRALSYLGYKINHVQNITDVGHLSSDADAGEDKMKKAAEREKKTAWDVAKFYTEAYLKDIKEINIILPDVIPKATEHIKEMIELNKKIEKAGFTYFAGGNLYFDTSKLRDYGKLTGGFNEDQDKAHARVESDPNKKNQRDFVLWFTKSKFTDQDMKWESPWGVGYPGWHIECSAMSMKYLGDQFDIHCGGIDLIPVHHTNEIAQVESVTKKKWVNFWLHGEFILIDQKKMAKSEGNFITLKTIKDKGFDALDYRYFILTAQYRTQLNFSFDALEAAKNARSRLNNFILDLKEKSVKKKGKVSEEYNHKFIDSLEDDLNMPKAVAVLWDLISDQDINSEDKLATILKFDEVFGLNLKNIKAEKIPKEITELIKQRDEARKNKDWKASDEIRNKISVLGYEVKDTQEGTRIVKK